MNKPRMKKWALGLGVGGFLFLSAAIEYARYMLAYQAPCFQPCADLGLEVARENPSSHDKTYRPKCQPIELAAELAKPEAKAGQSYVLWYRISLKNRSCLKLGVTPGPFIDEEFVKRNPVTLTVSVTDSNGIPAEALPQANISNNFFRPPIQTEFGTGVIPFINDFKAFKRIDEEFHLPDHSGTLDMMPGQIVTTTGVTWWPHTKELRDVHGVDEQGPYDGTAMADVPAKVSGPIPRTFPGYRVYECIFNKPGIYHFQAVFNEKDVFVEKIYPFSKRAPFWIVRSMSYLNILGIDLFPKTEQYEYKRYDLHAESRVLEFKVNP